MTMNGGYSLRKRIEFSSARRPQHLASNGLRRSSGLSFQYPLKHVAEASAAFAANCRRPHPGPWGLGSFSGFRAIDSFGRRTLGKAQGQGAWESSGLSLGLGVWGTEAPFVAEGFFHLKGLAKRFWI